ncbi:MAG: hypothetical protein IPO22_19535, partial [Anaerolineales bacterium]|nr:hypothetical protein [Anaerolineales bacterium]
MADLVITGYELTEDAAGLVPIASNRPDPDQTFYVKIFIKNRGGTVAPPFYRSVYFQSRFTPLLVSLPGHEEDPPETYYEAGCLYSSNPQEPDLGDYHPDNLFPGIPAGSSDDGLTVEVTNGLADGAYTLWLYADAACNVVEGVEDKDNNDFGPITLNVG